MKKKRKYTNRFLDGTKYKNTFSQNNPSATELKHARHNFLFPRLKAFLVDMFLINMPILYLTTYVILQGKSDFVNNQPAIALCTIVYCGILFCFLYFKGQTPGFRYAEIMLCTNSVESERNLNNSSSDSMPVTTDTQTPCAWQVFVFLFIWLVELSCFLWILSFVRKDNKTLHELVSKTKIVYKRNPARL